MIMSGNGPALEKVTVCPEHTEMGSMP